MRNILPKIANFSIKFLNWVKFRHGSLSAKNKRILLVVLIFIIIEMFVAPSWYFYHKYKEVQETILHPELVKQKKTQQVVDRVNKLIQLPKDEVPTLMSISNKDKVVVLPFFTKAENGDIVLVYEKAKIAYLYRPSSNQIVNVAPINNVQSEISSQTTQSTSSSSSASIKQAIESQIKTESAVQIEVRNGTKTSGLAKTTADNIHSLSSVYSIKTIGNAAKTDYDKTIVVSMKPAYRKDAVKLADYLRGELTDLPENESSTEADILVIVAQ